MEIELTQGQVALVSPQDYGALSSLKWHAVRCGKKFYAKRFGVFMHRQLMADKLDAALVVDHINGNSLDNRRENLRVVSAAVNARNLWSFKCANLRGVFKQGNGHVARISGDYLGIFETDVEAAFAVNEHLNKLDGDIGYRNHIDYDRLLGLLEARKVAMQAQIEQVRRARK